VQVKVQGTQGCRGWGLVVLGTSPEQREFITTIPPPSSLPQLMAFAGMFLQIPLCACFLWQVKIS
jgi:hypothetical protein